LANSNAMLPDSRDYAAFGLRIASQIALPELTPIDDDGGTADLDVVIGAVDPHLAGAHYHEPAVTISDDRVLLDLPPARYLVEDGCKITIDPTAGASEREVRVWLLGAVMGVVCHQRGLVPLHASAIEINGAAVAFMGHSGAGKSTLSAWFHGRGRQVLCDDLCAVGFDVDGRPRTWPGVPRIKLWRDALAALNRPPAGLEKVARNYEKYILPISAEGLLRPRPLAGLYLLSAEPVSAGKTITRLQGAKAVGAVEDNIYRWGLAVKMRRSRALFANCVALATHCEVFRVDRSRGLGQFEDEAVMIGRHLLASA
jgi:hypothetical protein